WPEHPVNLEPMRAEVARIKAAARARQEAKLKAEEQQTATNAAPGVPTRPKPTSPEIKPSIAETSVSPMPTAPESSHQRELLLGLIVALLGIGAVYLARKKSSGNSKK
ncbi:MAG: hypothetical protein JWR69_2458, partial [Pedosphaera sp.]|nr:hypothetical protein [Pedosphaera sp.]